MKKNKLYIALIIILIIVSCNKNNLQKGLLYSKSYGDLNYEYAKEKAIDEIYFYIAKETADIINRNDYNVVAFSLKDDNLIDFNDDKIANIKRYKKGDNFFVEITVKDESLYNRIVESLNKMKKEGFIENTVRANASIEIPDSAKLNPYTRQILTLNALRRAYESLYKILLLEGIEINKAMELTNNAYILEENYGLGDYNVVIETELKR